MTESVLRASKFFDISQNCKKEAVSLQPGKCRSLKSIALKKYQRFLFNSHFSVFFSIEKSQIYVKDIARSKEKIFELNQEILPIIEIDADVEDNGAYFVTQTGNLFKLSINGVLSQQQLPFVPTCFHVSKGNIFLGRNNGEVSLLGEGNLIYTVNKQKSFLKDILNKFISMSAPVLSISSTKNYLYFITSDCKLFTVDTEKGMIVSENTLSDIQCTSAIIETDGDTILVITNTNEMSVLKVLKEENDDIKVQYGLERNAIIDAVLSRDTFAIIEGTVPIVSFTRFDRESGNFVASDWTPADDYEFYMKFSVVTIEKLKKTFIDQNAISPITVACDKNNNLYIASSLYAYVMRPLANIENILTFCKTEPTFDTVEGLAATISTFLSKAEWNEIDAELKNGSDPIVVFNNVANTIATNAPQNLDEGYIINQLDEIIASIGLAAPQGLPENKSLNKFWASAVTQVGRAVSFYSRCLLLLVQFLTKNVSFKLEKQAAELNDIVKTYTRISVLLDNNAVEDLQLFESLEFSAEDFSVQVKSQISKLLFTQEVAQMLCKKGKHNVALAYLNLFEEKFIEAGFAMLELKKGTRAVAFFKENKDKFDFAPIYKDIIKKFVKLANNTNTSEFCEIVYELDHAYICPILFGCYTSTDSFDKAFKLVIEAPDDYIRVDLIRIFIRDLMKKKQLDKLVQLNFGQYTSLLINELMSYSVKTLPAAAVLMQKLGDKTGAIDALYLYARTLLRENKIESMRRAMTSLITCKALMSAGETAVRDVSSKKLVKVEKINKIIAKLRVCLGHQTPVAAINLSNVELLECAMSQGIDVMMQFAASGVATPEELANFGKILAKKGKNAELSKLLTVDRREWHFCIHEEVLLAFIEMGDPPYWFTQQMVGSCKVQFFILCSRKLAKYAALDGISVLRDLNQKLPYQLKSIVSNLGIPEPTMKEIIES